MSDAFRPSLRALPEFPEDLPDFYPDEAPDDPAELFRQWLREALAAGVPQPHACSRLEGPARRRRNGQSGLAAVRRSPV